MNSNNDSNIIANANYQSENKETIYSIQYDCKLKNIQFLESGNVIAEHKGTPLESIVNNLNKFDFNNLNAGIFVSNQNFILPAYAHLSKENEKEESIEIIKCLLNEAIEDLNKQISEAEEGKQLLNYESNYTFKNSFMDKYYQQEDKKLFLYKSDSKDPVREFKGLFSLNKITRYNDIAGTSESKYIIEYWNGLEDKLIETPKLTREELTKHLNQQDIFDCTYNELELIIRKIIIHTKANGDLKIENEVINEGYFLDIEKNEILENTEIKGFKPTFEETDEALKVLIELITTDNYERDKNLATILKTMLHMPYHWILKNIGYSDNLKGLIISGSAGTGKTNGVYIGWWLYGICSLNEDISADTKARYTTLISETTMPSLIDEGYNILNTDELRSSIKRQIHTNQSRSKQGGKGYEETVCLNALSTPIFTLNENISKFFKDGIDRRFKSVKYVDNMKISEDDKEEFIIKYKPRYVESPLQILKCIGAEFRDYIIPMIINRDNKLLDLDSLVNEFFQELLRKHGLDSTEHHDELLQVAFDLENQINRYAEKEDIQQQLNKEFRTARKLPQYQSHYTINDIIAVANSGALNWLHYQKNNNEFVIDSKLFLNQLQELTNLSLDLNHVLNLLEIESHIEKINVKGKTIQKGIRIEAEDLAIKVFSINLDISS